MQARIDAGAINLRIREKHVTSEYIRLFEAAYKHQEKRKKPIKIRGDQYAVIGKPVVFEPEKGEQALYGLIHKFSQIDMDGNWYNFETGSEAGTEETGEIHVPEHLKPNYKRYYFVFYPGKHRFVFQCKGPGNTAISPSSIKLFLEGLLGQEGLLKEFGKVDLTIEPTVDALEKIIRIRRIVHFDMEIFRPNPDDLGDIEDEILDDLRSQEAEKVNVSYSAEKGGGLKLSDRTKSIAEVAASNGYVKAKGRDANNKPVSESTLAHPLVEKSYYNVNTQLEVNAFKQLAKKIMKMLS